MKNLYSSRRFKDNKGQALIEFILILPMVFLLIVNLVNFGGFFYAWITVANAARAGANYASLGGASVGLLGTATGTQITNVIRADIASLPNRSSLVVNVCKNVNGTVSNPPLAGTCTSIPADPEPASSILVTVDVTYTYVPFIRVFSFPSLGVYLTLPPTTVYQRAQMRSII
jgi:Flp pilus assembly protein TadG